MLIVGGRIEEVGTTRRIENLRKARNARVIDVRGKVVTPGLIDSHMRISTGPPALEAFERRIAGLEAPRADLGAQSRDRPGSAADRAERARRWLRMALIGGATTVEVHSGGGLAPLEELRELRGLARLVHDPVEVSIGHTSAPVRDRGLSRKLRQAAAAGIEEVLSRASATPRIATTFHLDCGEGWFDSESARQCIQFAHRHGYLVKVRTGGGRSNSGVRLAVESGALGVERLEAAVDADVDLLAGSSTVATLLPSVASNLGSRRFPPARRLLDRGAIVSLASGFSPDYHPGFGLQMAMALACRELRMMPEEAITCCTINAAVAVGRAATIGSLEPNKQADLAVFDVPDYREIPYFFGVDLCWMTMKRGRVVYRAGGPQPLPPTRRPREKE